MISGMRERRNGGVCRHPGERERVNPVVAHSPLTGTVAASPCVTMPV